MTGAPFALVDAHHHLWDLGAHYYPWLADHPEPGFFLGDYAALKRDYLPADYRRDAAGLNVVATVHCEAEWDRADQVGETRWLTGVAGRAGMPDALVAHAWFDADNTEEVLAAQAAFPMVRGIRSKPATPGSDAGRGSMRDDRWLRGYALLQRHGLSYDLRVPYPMLPDAAEVARAFPAIPVVLNHTGFPWDRSDEGLAAWRRAMEAIADCPNVHLKVSEFGLKDRPWNEDENRRIVLDALAIFGVGRCMFASNFPVASLRIGYADLVAAMRRMTAHLSRRDQDRFFRANAAAFYRLAAQGTDPTAKPLLDDVRGGACR